MNADLAHLLLAHWPVVLAAFAGLALLGVPSLLRRRCPGAAATRAVDAAAGLCAMPARLLALLHGGDVRGHVLWITLGAIALASLAWNAPLPSAPLEEAAADVSPWLAGDAAADHVDLTATYPHLALVAAAIGALLARIALRDKATVPALGCMLLGVAFAATLAIASSSLVAQSNGR